MLCTTKCLVCQQSSYHIPCCLCSTRGPYGLLHSSRSSTLCSWPDKSTDWTTCLGHGSGREKTCYPRYSGNCLRVIQKTAKIDYEFFQHFPEIIKKKSVKDVAETSQNITCSYHRDPYTVQSLHNHDIGDGGKWLF